MNAFTELKDLCSCLAVYLEEAQEAIASSPDLALDKLADWGHLLIQVILAFEGIDDVQKANASSRMNRLTNRGLLPTSLQPFFQVLKAIEAPSALPESAVRMRAKRSLQIAARLAIWFVKSYGTHLPATISSIKDTEALIQTIREFPPSDAERRSARKTALSRASTMRLPEDETRVIIDYQLRNAGWEVETWSLRHSSGARPEKNTSKAIAEWPTESGPADYALFYGLDFIGVVEAKKMGKDVLSDLIQSKRYSRDARLDGQAHFPGGPWGEYRVPFLFSTNARPYLEQLKEKSGIWFLDVRESTNHPRPLQGWYAAEELADYMAQDIPASHTKLDDEPMDYLGLRGYQEKAVELVEAALEKGRSKLLVAMATGTGKTRLAIGLIYRLIKSGRFRRILFVVDRKALGEQAGDNFKETRLEELKTFDQIYDLKEVDKIEIETTTKVNIATVQGLMRAIMNPSEKHPSPSVGKYDCIIVDEAHRGYTLDRELGEDELPYRDQSDYLSKYRRVIDYFDAVKIGLTATPAPHTSEIFGLPVYTYSYREAVIDGWLIDHEPPHQLLTHLAKDGIKWEKGDTIPVYDPATGQITNIENIPDEIKLEIDHFNKAVVTEPFNLTVAGELVKYLNPDGDAKTLIYAATDDHADMVVRLLKDAFEETDVPVDDDAIVKITGSIDKPEGMIRKFKNERLPNIAVTVDLLTTGIDVPEICNLVFIRRVRSRILFEQMLGRATRRCDRIKKEHFQIFDAETVQEFIDALKGKSPEACRKNLVARRSLLAFLDENRHRPRQQLISTHEDHLHSHTRGYGDARKPEDYLNAFKEFIIANLNKIPALTVVCQRPRELTRQALKELKLALDQAGFTEKNLQVAWKDWKNEDIAADIISFIRRQALGDPLVSHMERIQTAMARIYAMKEWTAIQRQWLERIEKQLIAQTIMDREDFDRGAFAANGGFNRLNKIFKGNFQQVLDDITATLYPDKQEAA